VNEGRGTLRLREKQDEVIERASERAKNEVKDGARKSSRGSGGQGPAGLVVGMLRRRRLVVLERGVLAAVVGLFDPGAEPVALVVRLRHEVAYGTNVTEASERATYGVGRALGRRRCASAGAPCFPAAGSPRASASAPATAARAPGSAAVAPPAPTPRPRPPPPGSPPPCSPPSARRS